MNRTTKILVWTLGGFLVLVLGLTAYPFIVYRLPSGQTRKLEREIRYQVVDYGQNGGLRWLFEDECGNRRLFLEPEDSVPTWIYVSSEDFKKCWPVSLSKMRQDTFTFVAKLEAKPLLIVKDYAPAKVIDVRRIRKFPVTAK